MELNLGVFKRRFLFYKQCTYLIRWKIEFKTSFLDIEDDKGLQQP